MLAKITSKGQTTIPREVRVRLGLHPGDHLQVWLEGDRMVARRAELGERADAPRQKGPGRDEELLVAIFGYLDALKRHQSEIVRTSNDEVLLDFAVRHLEEAGRAARAVSESLRSAGSPMLPWGDLTTLPSSGLTADEAKRWVRERLDLPHGLLRTYFDVVPVRAYLHAP